MKFFYRKDAKDAKLYMILALERRIVILKSIAFFAIFAPLRFKVGFK